MLKNDVCQLGIKVHLITIGLCCSGYDSCAHMSEETQGAFLSAPYAILLAIGSSAVLGYILLVVLVICVQVSSQPASF